MGPQVRVGIGIMSHVTRADQAGVLFSTVAADEWVMDYGEYGETVAGDMVWENLAKHDTDWSIVLQDDALPIADFSRHAAEALPSSPLTAVSFYVGTCRPRPDQVKHAVRWANATDASWLEANTLLWGVGVAMPTVLIPGFLEWTKTEMIGTDAVYDARIGYYMRLLGFPVRYTWPSLVDHADGPSLVRKPRPPRVMECPRVAHKVGVPPSWDGPVVHIPARGEPFQPFPLSE